MNCPKCESSTTRMMMEAPNDTQQWICGKCGHKWIWDKKYINGEM